MNKIVGTLVGGVLGFFLGDLANSLVPSEKDAWTTKLMEVGGTAFGAGVGYLLAPNDVSLPTTGSS